MRIALVTTEYVTEPNFAGGLANYTYRVARGLWELGHEAEVFVYGTSEASFEHDGIPVHRLQVRTPFHLRIIDSLQRRILKGRHARDVHLLNIISTFRAGVKKRHQQCPFDIVHYTHLIGSGAMRTRLPSVVRLSSYRDLVVPFGFQFTSRFEGFLEDLALKRADAVFGPSAWVADYVRSKLGVPMSIVESPFVTPQSNENPSAWQQYVGCRKRYGLYFGSIAEWKGVYVLAEALNTILAEHKDLHFVFVGRDLSRRNGKPASEFILQELSAFEGRVIHLAAMRHAQLFPIVRHADFVALPSLADNFPNTCLEAMALGKIVVGTRGRGFDQLIQDGKNGLLCEPGDVASLTNALRRAATLCENDKEQMGKLAQERIGQLAPQKVVAQLVAFYEEVILRKQRWYSQKPHKDLRTFLGYCLNRN